MVEEFLRYVCEILLINLSIKDGLIIITLSIFIASINLMSFLLVSL